MKRPVILSLEGTQYFGDQEPDVIQLVTEGTMEFSDGGWNICYEESDLTGLAGVTTTFRVEREQVILRRTGKLRSEMVFREGESHDSLYQMEFGALLITVCAKRIEAKVSDAGGTVELVYSIEIEHGDAGLVEYHLEIRAKE